MTSKSRSQVAALLLSTLPIVASCARGPAPVTQPGIDPDDAGSQAMEMYDTNGDGKVAGDELEKSPSLKVALPRLDTNSDSGVSADEVAARVNAWKAMRTGLASVRCQVTLDGKPLPGAQVVFEPEPFLGQEIKTATGTTNPFGDAAPTIAPEDRPDPTLPGGVHFGLYRVRITKPTNGQESLPARYNKETTLGQEVSYDDPGIMNNNVAYELSSN
jgi:hypothetical protein